MFTLFTQNYDAILIISYLAIITLIYSSCACAWSKLKNVSNPDVYLPWSIKSIECIQPYSTSQPRSQIQTLLFCDSVHGFSLWSFSNVELTRTFPLASQLVCTLYYSVHKIEKFSLGFPLHNCRSLVQLNLFTIHRYINCNLLCYYWHG